MAALRGPLLGRGAPAHGPVYPCWYHLGRSPLPGIPGGRSSHPLPHPCSVVRARRWPLSASAVPSLPGWRTRALPTTELPRSFLAPPPGRRGPGRARSPLTRASGSAAGPRPPARSRQSAASERHRAGEEGPAARRGGWEGHGAASTHRGGHGRPRSPSWKGAVWGSPREPGAEGLSLACPVHSCVSPTPTPGGLEGSGQPGISQGRPP